MQELAKTRFEFLIADLDLAMTFVGISRTELKMSDIESHRRLLDKARMALDTVRRLMSQPPKFAPERQRVLDQRCAELESAIEAASQIQMG